MNGHILRGTKYGTKGRERAFVWRHILFRALWNMVWLTLAAWTPPQLYLWRRILLIAFGADVKKGARVYGSARIWYPPNFEMGRGAVLGPHSLAYTMDRIVIEEYAVVSQYSMLITGTHDINCETFQLYTKPLRIGRHAWIAARAFVGPGVTVGEGAVLGACGVAFSDLDPWSVYVGNPARAIKVRNRFVKA